MADRTPLYDRHVAAGARMFEFGGWEMPLWYSSIGEEHLGVREKVGIFDVSHMGKILVDGPEAELERLLTRSLSKRSPGRCAYSMLLDDAGRIIDDLIVLRVSEARHFIVCNASKRAKVLAWMEGSDASFESTDMTTGLGCLAVQGPRAAALMEKVAGPAVTGLRRYQGGLAILRLPNGRSGERAPFDWCKPISLAADEGAGGMPALVTRTGYTGEDGFEVFPLAGDAGSVWDGLMQAGEGLDVLRAGLGARDTLRLEMCYLLSGHDFDGSQTPLQADAGFAIDWDHDFVGKGALSEQRGKERTRLAAFESVGKGIPREGYPLLSSAGKEIGTATSGTMSPSLKIGIGMGYLPTSCSAPGTKIFYKVGMRSIDAKVVDKPFLNRKAV